MYIPGDHATVKLTTNAAGRIFIGRKKSRGKPKITSVVEFNRKLVFIRRVSNAGCPFSVQAITRIESKIDALTRLLLTKIKVLVSKKYSDLVEQNTKVIDLRTIIVQTHHYDATSMKLMNALVVYDEFNQRLIIDTLKRTGRIKITQPEALRLRRKFRRCIESVLEYEDVGCRGVVSEKMRSSDRYKKMVSLYGDPEEKTENIHAGMAALS